MPGIFGDSEKESQLIDAAREKNAALQLENRVLQAALGQISLPSASESPAKPLSLHEKLDLATSELEKIQAHLRSAREGQEESLARVDCATQAAHFASQRARMDALELHRKLADPGAGLRNAQTNAQALVAHLTHLSQRRREAAEQYTSKAQRLKAQCQAQEVEGRGQDSRLHAIDLAELRMGNTKLVKGMEERVKQVALQKLASGRSAQALEQQQRVLNGLLDSCHETSGEIAMRKAQLVRFDQEIEKYKQRQDVAERRVAEYKEVRQSAPSVADYIKLKNEVLANEEK